MLKSSIRPVLVAAALGSLVALTACAPETPAPAETSAPPAPTATASAGPTLPIPVGDLELTPEGLGSLVFGQAADDDPELGMVHLDPAACTDEQTGFDAGISEGDPLAALWVANESYRDGSGRPLFGVNVEPGGVVTRIDLFSSDIRTDENIRIGDPADAALAAYPDAEVRTGDLSDLMVIEGDFGILQIEIARETGIFGVPYWSEAEADTVRYINASLGTQPFNVVASDNVAGVCPF